jgi:predicted enzyme related to lactoylglutathione lyase
MAELEKISSHFFRSLRQPHMNAKIFSVVIPVSDMAAAKAVYQALYGAPHMDTPYYVGFKAEGIEVGLTPQADRDLGAVVYASVENLDGMRDALISAGAKERSAPKQVAPGLRVCVLEDKDGNPVGLSGK